MMRDAYRWRDVMLCPQLLGSAERDALARGDGGVWDVVGRTNFLVHACAGEKNREFPPCIMTQEVRPMI